MSRCISSGGDVAPRTLYKGPASPHLGPCVSLPRGDVDAKQGSWEEFGGVNEAFRWFQPSGSHTTFLSCQTVSFWLVGFPANMVIGTGTRGHSSDLKSDDIRPSEEDLGWL